QRSSHFLCFQTGASFVDLKGRNLLSSLFSSSRSSLTCTYKCGNACFGACDNTSSNPYFGDQFSRRNALRAGGLAVVAVGGGAALAACAPPSSNGSSAATSTTGTPGSSPSQHISDKGMQFTPVEPNTEDAIVIPEGYEQS